MRPKQLTLPGIVPEGDSFEGPKLGIRCRPAANPGVVLGVASVTIASAITVYPIRIMQGTKGCFIAFPQQRREDKYHDVVFARSAEARAYIQRHVLKTFEPNKETIGYVQGYVHPEVEAVFHPAYKAGSNLVGMASVFLEDMQIDTISVYRNRDGTVHLYFPQRHWVSGGERRMANVVYLTDAYQDRVLEAVTNAYRAAAPVLPVSQIETQNPAHEKEPRNQFHDFEQRKYSQEEWEDIELWMQYKDNPQKLAEARQRAAERRMADAELVSQIETRTEGR